MIYDIIGDIHGQADKLIGLLEQLGYTLSTKAEYAKTESTNTEAMNYYQPPANHRALFIGDLIDRGEQEIKTLEIVFAMLDADVADAIMGNHEYNALAYATKNKIANDGSYLRPHKKRNHDQHKAFLTELPFGSKTHQYWLNRFYELPLWIETEQACFVHACWDVDSMSVLSACLTNDNTLTQIGLQKTGQNNSPEFLALERVLKGVETPLPSGLFMLDKGGEKRHNVRVMWWLDNLNNRTIQEIARVPSSGLTQIPKNAIAEAINFKLKTTKPIFIGHYWLQGKPEPLSNQVVCTDYSAAVDSGYLTCYQFDTDTQKSTNQLHLNKDNFVQFNHKI